MRRAWGGVVVAAATLVAVMPVTEAHKPITSPFTYAADVLPIVRERCGQCHAPGGVAPMSLLTYNDAVPWGESMRVELTAGHMPPWSIDRGMARFRAPGNLSAREMNVLLTWATGGTPAGELTSERETAASPAWSMGPPDAVIDLPAFTLRAEEQEKTAEFILAAATGERLLRAIDLLPGTPAMVRSATVDIDDAASVGVTRDEHVLALWVPGDQPTPFARGALRIPAGAALRVRMRYRKTWLYEGKELKDQSRVGLYFATPSATAVRAIALSPGRAVTLSNTIRVLAVYPDEKIRDASVAIAATRPGSARDELIAFHPRVGWTRRFWLREPLMLPRGTVLSVRIASDTPGARPVGGTVTVDVAP